MPPMAIQHGIRAKKGKPQEQGNGVSFPADQLRNDCGQHSRHHDETGYVQNPVQGDDEVPKWVFLHG